MLLKDLFMKRFKRLVGTTKVEISEMIKSVKASYKKFNAAKVEKKKCQSEAHKKIVEKRKATLELKEVEAKKKALVSEMQSEITRFDTDYSPAGEVAEITLEFVCS